MKIEQRGWEQGSQLQDCRYTITNQHGNSATFSTYGASVTEVLIKDSRGKKRDVVLGYQTLREYKLRSEFLGACVGRFGGWIKNGKMIVDGRCYQLCRTDGKNHLHGGRVGFDKRTWEGSIQGNKVVFRRISPDGEEGYPGTLRVKITYEFTEDDTLRITYDAVCDSDTVCNLTNHTYFNLNGEGDVLGHQLCLKSDQLNDNDSDGISSLGVRTVSQTPFDFTVSKEIGLDIHTDCEQLRFGHGYDHNFYLGEAGEMKLAAVLSGEKSGISMEVHTNQSGIQLYTGNYLEGWQGKRGISYGKYAGVCLEPQFCPSEEERSRGYLYPVIKKGEAYHHEAAYHFYLEKGRTEG